MADIDSGHQVQLRLEDLGHLLNGRRPKSKACVSAEVRRGGSRRALLYEGWLSYCFLMCFSAFSFFAHMCSAVMAQGPDAVMILSVMFVCVNPIAVMILLIVSWWADALVFRIGALWYNLYLMSYYLPRNTLIDLDCSLSIVTLPVIFDTIKVQRLNLSRTILPIQSVRGPLGGRREIRSHPLWEYCFLDTGEKPVIKASYTHAIVRCSSINETIVEWGSSALLIPALLLTYPTHHSHRGHGYINIFVILQRAMM